MTINRNGPQKLSRSIGYSQSVVIKGTDLNQLADRSERDLRNVTVSGWAAAAIG